MPSPFSNDSHDSPPIKPSPKRRTVELLLLISTALLAALLFGAYMILNYP